MLFNKLMDKQAARMEIMIIKVNLLVVLLVLKANNLDPEEIAAKVKIHLKMQIVSSHRRDQKLEEIENQIKDNYFKV